MKREIRTFRTTEMRAASNDAGAKSIDGYAAIFNSAYEVKCGDYVFREVIKSGAFTRALKEKQDVRCLINHDDNLVLARSKSGTLEMKQDSKGLFFNVPELPETTYANDLHVSMKRGDIDQCSFCMVVTKQSSSEEKDKDGRVIYTRTIEDVDLFDVSVVTYPAYEDTSCEARSAFPDGEPESLKQLRADQATGCKCQCAECVAGSCDDCTNGDCADKNCEGCASQRSNADFKARAELRLRLQEKL